MCVSRALRGGRGKEEPLSAIAMALQAAVITYDGRLLKQARGIPMGSALSPPLAIGTLAWMEHEWMQTLEDDAKARFRMKRYMDDVITVTAKDDSTCGMLIVSGKISAVRSATGPR